MAGHAAATALPPGRAARLALLASLPLLGSCSGIQSALDPAGEEAAQVATLFWAMTAAGAAIWAGVVALSLHASRAGRAVLSEKAAGRLIFWAGAAFPAVALTVLLGFALWLMPSLRPFAAESQSRLVVEVVARQFWWQVHYLRAGEVVAVSSNEVRLPVGERVEFRLESADMIHSFWIPALGGKMDLVPGRSNRLSLKPVREGIYRGQCAEFCGVSHALMAFDVHVMAPEAFEAWLGEIAEPSAGAAEGHRGREIFLREGCGECHRIAGTAAAGSAGPDLSHLASRRTIGAGLLPNGTETLTRFIVHPASVKPGSRMPAYTHLSAGEAEALAGWLGGLE